MSESLSVLFMILDEYYRIDQEISAFYSTNGEGDGRDQESIENDHHRIEEAISEWIKNHREEFGF